MRDDPRAARDLVFAALAVVAVTCVALWTHVVDRLLQSSPLDGHGTSGAVALLVALPVAASVFSYRRYRDAAAARHELAAISMLDSLTGLPNRRSLPDWYADALARAAHTSSSVAVLFVDLDRFKSVNDMHGHDCGDRVIAEVASRLRVAVRPDDGVIRYGGDEFVILCNGIVTPAIAVRVAERIVEHIERPIDVDGEVVHVSASVGIAIVDGPHDTMDQALSTADSAMYRAKADGAGRCVVLEPGRTPAGRGPSRADELRAALDAGQFVVHFQPVVSMRDKSMIGAEALLRWQHPERGLLLPGLFVDDLEESGLIVAVGAWVLETVCQQVREWQDAHPHLPFQVAVNVSGRQLADPDFSSLVLDTVRATGVLPSRLCFEITEGAIIQDIDGAWATLRAAKDRGIKLALDDFGTGYSSLSYLRRFKTDVLKIDRTFVQGLGRGHEDTAIVEHVIGLAHALGMTTVAEGIEREEQYLHLARAGCDHGQGFWFSQAQPATVVSRLLRLRTAETRRGVTSRVDDLVLASSHAEAHGA